MEIREDAVQGLNDSGGTDNIGDRDQSWLFDGVDLWGLAILVYISVTILHGLIQIGHRDQRARRLAQGVGMPICSIKGDIWRVGVRPPM